MRLEILDGAPSRFALPSSSSASSFFSTVLSGLDSGRYRVAVVSNGVSSLEKIIGVETTPVLASYPAASVTVGGSMSLAPSSIPPGYAGTFYAQRATSSGSFSGRLQVNGATGEVHVADAGPTGNYTITVASSNSCGAASTTFALKVLGPPSSMIATGGTPQSTAINTPFATPLQVTVTDGAGHALENVSVAFTPPAAGASAILTASSALTNASGIASISATANGTMGAYSVTATVGGLTATFALTNAPAIPTGTNALATTVTSVSVSWTGTPGATYQIARVTAGGTTTTLGTSATSSYVDNTAIAGTAYLYKVRATAPFVTAYGIPDLATTIIFTDPTLSVGSTPIRAAHITQLRSAVNAVRALAAMAAATYTDPVITAGVTKVNAVHVTDLRAALGAARSALALPTVTFVRPSLANQVIQTSEIVELRNGVK